MMRFLFAALAAAGLLSAAVPAFAQTGGPMPVCRSGDPVVWVNTSSNVYHLQGSKYYGNTKAGKYECKSAADTSGARQAKSSTGGTKPATAASPGSAAAGSTIRYTPVPHPAATAAPGTMTGPALSSPAASASPSGKRKRHHHAGPSPAASSPAAGGAMTTSTSTPAPSPKPKHRAKKTPAPEPSPT